MRNPSLLLVLLLGCSCPETTDAGVDVGTTLDAPTIADAGPDTASADAASVDATIDMTLAPPSCLGEAVMNVDGAVSGTAFGEEFSFPFIVAGNDDPNGLCPRVFIRAGESADLSGPTFSGRYFELTVHFGRDAVEPGIHTGSMEWHLGDAGTFFEEVMVNVTRADGFFESELPESERRLEFSLSHHDATTDIEAEVVVATYCNDFAVCL